MGTHWQVSFRFHQMNVSQWDFSKGFGKKVLPLALMMFETICRQIIQHRSGLVWLLLP
jgi:hypothetical protein